MTRIFLTSMVTVLGLMVSVPAMADTPAALSMPHADTVDDLPLTDAFASALSEYQDCVLAALGRGAVASPDAMARAAMSRCAQSQHYMRAQLIADISVANPGLGVDATIARADAGMATIEPMIEASAADSARDQISNRTQ